MLTASKEFKIFEFDELSDEAKDKAIEAYADINVDYDWYSYEAENTAEDWLAKYGISFKPGEIAFDLDRGQYLYFNRQSSVWVEDAGKLAMAIYGKGYNLVADKELLEFSFTTYYHGGGSGHTTLHVTDYRSADSKDLPADCADWFHDLVDEFWRQLRNEYDYQTGKEAIIETIKANEYQFFEDGRPSMTLCANTLKN